MGKVYGPHRRQLDAEARFHRSDFGLWFLFPWLQGRRRQSAGGGIAERIYRRQCNCPIHPLTFKPEFIDAFELGTKNTLLDGALTFNGDVFYYDYKDYQISEIVDRTSINLNFNATVKGAELETTWEPAPGLKFSFAGGYEDASDRQWPEVHRSDGPHGGQSGLDGRQTLGRRSLQIALSRPMSLQAILKEITTGTPGAGGGFGGNIICADAYLYKLIRPPGTNTRPIRPEPLVLTMT